MPTRSGILSSLIGDKMPLDPPLSKVELAGIERHTLPLIETADEQISVCRAVCKRHPSDIADAQLLYWVHVKAALKWSLNIARQRKLRGANSGT